MSGTLYVVATPIGNVDDFSERAIQTLQAVDLIAAEDTRHSQPMLARFNINTPIRSYHDFSTESVVDDLLARLLEGQSLALISDAGTPLVSDPGFRLVKRLREAGIAVLPVPGASALTAVLSVAGLPTDRFCFEGFLPAKSGPRQARLGELVSEPRTLVFYESPHRIEATVADLALVFGAQRGLDRKHAEGDRTGPQPHAPVDQQGPCAMRGKRCDDQRPQNEPRQGHERWMHAHAFGHQFARQVPGRDHRHGNEHDNYRLEHGPRAIMGNRAGEAVRSRLFGGRGWG